MDTGKDFWKKTISREPIKKIQEAQKFIQENYNKTGYIHLSGKNDRIFSVLIPGAFVAAGIPLLAYSLYTLYTKNSSA